MIKETFEQLKNCEFSTRNFYMNEYYSTKWETQKLCYKIAKIFDTATKWIYEIEKTDENMLKYINRILKAYKKAEKYQDLLSY